MQNKYTDYSKFAEKIGILEEEELIALGWYADNGNRICYSKHEELVDFIDKLNTKSIDFIKDGNGKQYHIATDLDAGGIEHEAIQKFCKENKIAEKDSEDVHAYCSSIVNKVSFVNRMDYFLCSGDADEDLFLEEVSEVRDDREEV